MATVVSYQQAMRDAYWTLKYAGDFGGLGYSGTSLFGMLLTNSHTPSAAYLNKAQVVANEVATGAGYTTGGKQADKSPAIIDLAGTAELQVISFTWPALTKTFRYLVVYHPGTYALDVGSWVDPLIAYIDFGGDITVTAADFKTQLPANGIYGLAG